MSNQTLLGGGGWGESHLDFRYRLPGTGVKPPHGASSVEVEK